MKANDIFLTTKLWPGNPQWGDPPKDFDDTIAACETSLKMLQRDSVDLYLIHAPFAGPKGRLAQWKALCELKKQGKVKAIGVSNWTQEMIEALAWKGLEKPAVNQIELHPLCQRKEYVAWMKSQDIQPVAYSSLAPLSSWRSNDEMKGNKDDVADRLKAANETFMAIAQAYKVSEAQVLYRWALQKHFVVLPKSSKPERIIQNLDIFNFNLSEEDISKLDALAEGQDRPFAWKSDPMQ